MASYYAQPGYAYKQPYQYPANPMPYGYVYPGMGENQGMTDMQQGMESIKNELEDIKRKLQERTNELEQYKRRLNLRIYGVCEEPNESTLSKVLEIFRKLIEIPVRHSDLTAAFRCPIKKTTNDRYRPITVVFTNMATRNRIYKAKSRLKGTGYIIQEDLIVERARIIKVAVLKFSKSSVWSQYGIINIVHNGVKYQVSTWEQYHKVLQSCFPH